MTLETMSKHEMRPSATVFIGDRVIELIDKLSYEQGFDDLDYYEALCGESRGEPFSLFRHKGNPEGFWTILLPKILLELNVVEKIYEIISNLDIPADNIEWIYSISDN